MAPANPGDGATSLSKNFAIPKKEKSRETAPDFHVCNDRVEPRFGFMPCTA
jgi:hypothetical protein